jgi:hypothetical protein
MFAAEGAKVVVAEFSEPAGQETVRLISDAGGQATFVRTDVSSDADAKGMIDHAVATFGRVDVLYNNAGIMPEADHSVIDTAVDVWDQVMAVNVRGTYLGCKYAIPVSRAGLRISHRRLRGILGLQPRTPTQLEGRRPRLEQSLAVGRAGACARTPCPAPSRRPCSWTGWSRTGKRIRLAQPTGRFGKPGDRLRHVPGLGRVALDERRRDGRGRRHHRGLLRAVAPPAHDRRASMALAAR